MAEFEINGIASQYIDNADWAKANVTTRLNGLPVWGGYVSHVMTGVVMPVDDWRQFKALEGLQVTVKTVDYFSRGNFRTYAGTLKAVEGTQNSLNMLGVSITALLFLGTNPSPTIQGIP